MDKILFFDIDGTLGQHGVITESNLKALHLLKEKGYNPISQIVGYLVSGDPGYITNYKNARDKMLGLDRNKVLELMVRNYLEN